MADKINFRESEFSSMSSQMYAMHENQKQNIKTAIDGIKQLVNGAEGFGAKQTSKKIDSLLDSVNSDIVELLNEVYEASETSMTEMASAVTSTDTACN